MFLFLFAKTNNPAEKMAQNIREEITRLQRSKQLKFTSANLERMQDSDNSGSEMGADSPRRPDTPPTTSSADKGLFSFKQVRFIPTVLYI